MVTLITNKIMPHTSVIHPKKIETLDYMPCVTLVTKEHEINIVLKNISPNIVNFNKGMKMVLITDNFLMQTDIDKLVNQNNPNQINSNNEQHVMYQINTITEIMEELDKDQVNELRRKEITSEDFILDHLLLEKKVELRQFLMQNYKVFSKSYQTLGVTDAVKPDIKLAHQYP